MANFVKCIKKLLNFKDGNDEFLKSDKKVLMLEPHPYHQEILPGFVKYFNDLGYSVDLLIRNECLGLNVFCRFKHKLNIRYYDVSEIKEILSDCSGYDFIFFSSLEYEAEPFHGKYTDFLGFVPNTKYGILACHHTLTNIGGYNSVEYFNQGRVFSCSGFKYEDQVVPMLAPIYYGKIEKKHKLNRKKEFIVVGAITDYSKNHNLLFDTVTKLLEQNIKNFNITVIGNGALNIPKKLRKYITFKGALSFDKMFKCMEKADFYLPLMDLGLENHLRYLTNCCSGSRNLILGFNTPCLINETFGMAYDFNSDNSIIYRDNELFEAMKKAIGLSKSDYLLMQNNLQKLADDVYTISLENLRNSIEKFS